MGNYVDIKYVCKILELPRAVEVLMPRASYHVPA